MRLPQFFIDRPIFATVISVVIVLLGSIAYFQLPVARYPEIALPTVVVRASYPGATTETITSRLTATGWQAEVFRQLSDGHDGAHLALRHERDLAEKLDRADDLPERLDYVRMAQTVDGVHAMVRALAER